MKLYIEPFVLHRLIPQAHLQTIIADLFGVEPSITSQLTDFKVHLSDGDTLINEYVAGETPTVSLLCHGLTGDSRSSYILRAAQYLNQQGHHVVLMNHRNCGRGLGLATKPYNSGSGNDIGEVIQALKEKFPAYKIIVYGFSLSANALLRLLSEPEACFKRKEFDFKKYLPDFAMAVNPPTNLSRTSDMLSQGFNRIYEKNFIFGLRSTVKKLSQKNLLNDPEIQKNLTWSMKIKDFDDIYTSKLSGYKNADDYYQTCSTYKKFDRINIPTLILTSDDDPFVDAADFKNQKVSDAASIMITRGGGHLGYISHNKTQLDTHRWLDYAVVEFAKNCLR